MNDIKKTFAGRFYLSGASVFFFLFSTKLIKRSEAIAEGAPAVD